MSLNWKEIDLILSELDLVGAQIQRVAQPSFDSIALGLFGRGREIDLLLSVAHGAARLHRLSQPMPKNDRPLRFMECLRSRLRGGRVQSVIQLGDDRIVRFDISRIHHERAAEDGDGGVQRDYRLYAKLWSGGGNILLSDDDDIIIDALARRPGRGERAGLRFVPPSTVAPARTREPPTEAASDALFREPRIFEVRDLPAPETAEARTGVPHDDFNARVEAWYRARGGELSRESLLRTAKERFAKRRNILETRVAALEEQASRFRDSGRNRELGDLIMGNLDRATADRHLLVQDFYRGGELLIPVNPALSMVENAQAYYERAKKEASGLADVEEELRRWKGELAKAEAELHRLESLADPLLVAKALDKGGTRRGDQGGTYPGISLERSGWIILVGRSAKENDEILRRHARGSDLWLHARDWAGSYVFVKARKGKSVPLEILVDAGNLALYYSKGRDAGEGDLYYTWVKYLRRAKDGPKGLVIPTQEKNLHVRIDEARVKELRALMAAEP